MCSGNRAFELARCHADPAHCQLSRSATIMGALHRPEIGFLREDWLDGKWRPQPQIECGRSLMTAGCHLQICFCGLCFSLTSLLHLYSPAYLQLFRALICCSSDVFSLSYYMRCYIFNCYPHSLSQKPKGWKESRN